MTKDYSEQYKKELQDFGFPEIELANRSEMDLLSMRDLAVHFSRQGYGQWNYKMLTNDLYKNNFFSRAQVERRA